MSSERVDIRSVYISGVHLYGLLVVNYLGEALVKEQAHIRGFDRCTRLKNVMATGRA